MSTSLTPQQQALLWSKYWDMHDQHAHLRLRVSEKDETIALLRRDLVRANTRIAKLEQMVDPMAFLSSR
jgi:hypothetical protein